MSASVAQPRHMRSQGPGIRPSLPEPCKPVQAAFVCLAFALLVMPLVCMPFASSDAASEKRDLAPAPSLVVDGGVNLAFFSDLGAYFEDHFAFRSELVDANATLRQRLFMTSATPNVVVGSQGWLYYAGTLNDYRRTNAMSDHMLKNAAANLGLMQESLAARGKRFVLGIAPNKCSIYPQHMPYYERLGEGETNYERLLPLLRERGVTVVDLREVLSHGDDVLYYERDSHWNDAGALRAYEALSRALEHPVLVFEESDEGAGGHLGDIDAMLHPSFAEEERERHYVGMDAFSLEGESASVEDGYLIATSDNAQAEGTLIMYRDSFGNNLLKPFACSYQQAVFTKLVPYDMGEEMCAFAQDVIVERAERHISSFATDPPYLPAPSRSLAQDEASVASRTSLSVGVAGDYLVVEGTLDDAVVGEDDHVYVELVAEDGNAQAFEAFRVSQAAGPGGDFEGTQASEASEVVRGDWGYRAYLAKRADAIGGPGSVRILYGNEIASTEIARSTLA